MPVTEDKERFTVKFSGVSTILVDDGRTQVLIDGYFSRVHRSLFNTMAPDLEQIVAGSDALGIRDFECINAVAEPANTCASRQYSGLSVIIPAHGHYDHAMDSAIVAARHGAILLADESGRDLRAAARTFVGDNCDDCDWDRVAPSEYFDSGAQNARSFGAGSFKITLYRTEHFCSFITEFGAGNNPEDIVLPTSLFGMKEGVAVSILVEQGDKGLLIVPSSNAFETVVAEHGIKADVVMMGIGGNGWKSKSYLENVFTSLAEEAGAKRIIPIHWDKDSTKLFGEGHDSQNVQLEPSAIMRLDRTLAVMDSVTQEFAADVGFAPVIDAFDPFAGIDS
ncbi:MBL fold metallo-hydrolase [Shimia isoporae]|uniref:MBL fold metallo-hydrolase n=1 Tax=Shimia isoporae TaxID=647720 RepID=UPI00104712BF|nr:hypothetical protein [Shimia isoporae]